MPLGTVAQRLENWTDMIGRQALPIILAFVAGGILVAGAMHIRYAMREPPTSGPGSPAYDTDVSHGVLRSEQMAGAVAIFGDSHTERLATSRHSIPVENFAISGNRIEWIEASLPQYDLHGAKAVVIESGTPDLGRMPVAEFGKHYGAVLNLVPSKLPIIAMGMFPVRKPFADKYPDMQTLISETNRVIRQTCAIRPNCTFVPVPVALSGHDGWLLPQYAEADGVQMKAAAELIYLRALDSAIAAVLH